MSTVTTLLLVGGLLLVVLLLRKPPPPPPNFLGIPLSFISGLAPLAAAFAL